MSTTNPLYTSASLKAQNAPTFDSLNNKLDPALLEALRHLNYDFMTPVQEKVLHELPHFASDCIVQAKTGTGKTTAFLLPAVQNTLEKPPIYGQVSVLILSPTRELALQIAAEAQRLVSKMRTPLQVHTAFGGTTKASALLKFKNGDPKVVVATPGRLKDYLSEAVVRSKFDGMKTLVLDEADRMLDAGFLPDILTILRTLPPKNGTKAWQGMAFSATIPPQMEDGVFRHILSNNYTRISTLDQSEPPTIAIVPQYSLMIPGVEETFTALHSLLVEEIGTGAKEAKIIVFGTTANLVSLFAKVFAHQLGNLPVYELHSRLSQPARTKASDGFKAANNGIMFASDVIGRGMDFPDVTLVAQVGLPADSDSYIHRVGRTGRAGKGGRAVIMLTQAESFYLNVNRQFPIRPHPAQDAILHGLGQSQSQVNVSLRQIDPITKQKAYSAYLGFMKGSMNKLRMKPHELVSMANRFAIGSMLCEEIPEMERKTIGKMGLKGVEGIRYMASNPNQSSNKRGPVVMENEHTTGEGSRRFRHQGMPQAIANASSAPSTSRFDNDKISVADHGGRQGGKGSGSRGRGHKK